MGVGPAHIALRCAIAQPLSVCRRDASPWLPRSRQAGRLHKQQPPGSKAVRQSDTPGCRWPARKDQPCADSPAANQSPCKQASNHRQGAQDVQCRHDDVGNTHSNMSMRASYCAQAVIRKLRKELPACAAARHEAQRSQHAHPSSACVWARRHMAPVTCMLWNPLRSVNSHSTQACGQRGCKTSAVSTNNNDKQPKGAVWCKAPLIRRQCRQPCAGLSNSTTQCPQ